jgi:hypothetical protein
MIEAVIKGVPGVKKAECQRVANGCSPLLNNLLVVKQLCERRRKKGRVQCLPLPAGRPLPVKNVVDG